MSVGPLSRPAGTPTVHKREAINVAIGATEQIVVAWDEPFPNDTYTVVVEVETAEGSLGASLRIRRIVSRTAADVTIAVTNDSGLQALSGVLHVIAIADS